MTQSDPTPTPSGSGGVATGSDSAEHGANNGASNGSGNGQTRERVIPPAKATAAPPEQRSASSAERSTDRGRTTGARAQGATTQPSTQTSPQKSAQKSAQKSTQKSAAAPAQKSAQTSAQTGAPASGARAGRVSAPGSAPARSPRRARLRLTQIDAWTVMKTSFLLSIALGIVSVVAVAIVWTVLGAAGVFDSLNGTVQTLLGNDFRVQDYIGTGRVLGFTMLIAVVNVVLLTAIATLGAFLYNLSATLLGGIEVTLTEDH